MFIEFASKYKNHSSQLTSSLLQDKPSKPAPEVKASAASEDKVAEQDNTAEVKASATAASEDKK